MNHIRTYHYYWHIFFFSLLVCMTEFTKAADRGVLERVIYLAKSKGTVYTLLGKVSEQSGFLFVYDSKVVDNDRTVKLGAGQRTIRQVVSRILVNLRSCFFRNFYSSVLAERIDDEYFLTDIFKRVDTTGYMFLFVVCKNDGSYGIIHNSFRYT